ncbi:hypothetical protein [Herbidospora daliensis]|uniref:hypothetical protein n=1 Tax=Herbidospora daliensis TaxID=295585 RepID=UPI0007804BAA|nr:hypothetical protein [Herbidospora daliensis]
MHKSKKKQPAKKQPEIIVISDDSGDSIEEVSDDQNDEPEPDDAMSEDHAAEDGDGDENGDEDSGHGIPAENLLLLHAEVPLRDMSVLRGIVERHRETVKTVVDALDDGADTDELRLGRALLDDIRRVLPDPPYDFLLTADPEDADFWALVARAFSVKATDPIEILAEIAASAKWVPSLPTFPGQVEAIEAACERLRGKGFLLTKLRPMMNEIVEEGAFAQWPAMRAANRKNLPKHADWGKIKTLTQQWVAALMEHQKKALGATYPQQLAAMAADPGLADDRSMDRLADMIYCQNRDRVCVSVLRKGRDLAVFANNGTSTMGVSVARLLQMSRLPAERQNVAVEELTKTIYATSSKTDGEYVKIHRRLVKTLAYLKELEHKHGRLHVRAFVNHDKESEGVHAEMLAATVAETTGSDALGISKACCLQCYLTLTKGLPDRFARPLATHQNAYPGTPGALISDPEVLIRLLDLDAVPPHLPGDAATRLKTAIRSGPISAAVGAFIGFQTKGAETDYLSSEEESHLPEVDADDVAYTNYLSREEALQKTKRPVTATPAPTPKKKLKTAVTVPKPVQK